MRTLVSSARPAPLLLILLAFTPGCVRSGPSVDEVARAVQTRVDSARAVLSVRSERLLEPRAVARFYRNRRFRPTWSDDEFGRVQEAIQAARDDGLSPSQYHLAAIERLRQAEPKDKDAELMADLDVLLTDAVAALVDHLRYGRVRPTELGSGWNVDPRAGASPLTPELERVAGSGSIQEAIRGERPQHFIYAGLLAELARLRAIEAKGGWPTVPAGKSIRPGTLDPRIPRVRARLAASGELSETQAGGSTRYDPALVRAVKLFQARHRQNEDGIIGPTLIAAMNAPVATRIAEVRVNLERARWVLSGLGDDFLLVNLPAFKAYLIQGGKRIWEARTMIGEEAKQTPTFRSTMKTIVLNPDWTVPPMILAEEIIPAMQRGENYLAKKHIEVVDAQNQVVDASSIDWSSVNPAQFPYTLRQPPDDENALGKVKFLFPNKYSIYLHDTPARSLFQAEKRTFSHGCIRLENPLELAQIILSGQDSWDAAKIQQTLATGKSTYVNLERQLPVLIVYWTVSVGVSGEVRYGPDVYDMDPTVLAALDASPR